METKNEFDMIKAMKQAMELSKAFESGSKKPVNENNNSSSIDMDNMMKIVEMVKLMNTVAPAQEPKKEKEKEKPTKEFFNEDFNSQVTNFEDDINTPAINTIKSALPYLDYKYQKSIGLAVKFIEIQRILSKYSNETINMELTKNQYWRKDLILSIRPHMDDEKKKMIDTIIKLMNIKEVMDKKIN